MSGGRWQVRVLVPGLPLQACSVLLTRAREGGGKAEQIIVDTCFPQHDTLLQDGLARMRVAPGEITGIINTHYHLDHCGGNFLFPQAWVYGSKRDCDWAISIYESVSGGETRREVFRTFYPEATDEEFGRMDEARVLQLLTWMWDPAILGERGRYRWWEEGELGVEGLRVIPTPGHSPGHLAVQVRGEEGPYLLAGDARAFADDVAEGFDMPPHNRELFRRSRQRLDQFRGVVIPGHDDPFTQERESAAAVRSTVRAPEGRLGRRLENKQP
ncbi:MAG: MBL fold metallo-hydrolase [Terriglobales bacterium]